MEEIFSWLNEMKKAEKHLNKRIKLQEKQGNGKNVMSLKTRCLKLKKDIQEQETLNGSQ